MYLSVAEPMRFATHPEPWLEGHAGLCGETLCSCRWPWKAHDGDCSLQQSHTHTVGWKGHLGSAETFSDVPIKAANWGSYFCPSVIENSKIIWGIHPFYQKRCWITYVMGFTFTLQIWKRSWLPSWKWQATRWQSQDAEGQRPREHAIEEWCQLPPGRRPSCQGWANSLLGRTGLKWKGLQRPFLSNSAIRSHLFPLPKSAKWCPSKYWLHYGTWESTINTTIMGGSFNYLGE